MIWPRALVAIALLALPIWAGAAGRSLWSLAVLTPVFAIAYLDGRHRIVRERFAESDWREKLKAIGGALVSQSVLVALLFFVAAGVAAALGRLGDRAPYDQLDAGLAALSLAVALLGGAVIRWSDGGRDPVDRAIEKYGSGAAALRKAADALEQLDEELDRTRLLRPRRSADDAAQGEDDALLRELQRGDAAEDGPVGVALWRSQAAMIARSRRRVSVEVVEFLARRVAGHDDVKEAIALLREFCVWRDDAGGGVRRVGFVGLREMLASEEGHLSVRSAGLETLTATALAEEPELVVRVAALELAVEAPLRDRSILDAARAVLDEVPEDVLPGDAWDLRRAARRYLNGLQVAV